MLYEKAEKYYLSVMEASEKEDLPPVLNSNNFVNLTTNLASIYIAQGKYKKAENILLENSKHIIKNDNQILIQLGIIYWAQEQEKLAKKYFSRVINNYKNKKYKDDIFYRAKSNLASIEIRNGKYNEAEKLYLNNLNNIDTVNDNFKLLYIRNLYDLHFLYISKKDYPKATSYFLQVIEKTKTFLQKNLLFLTENEKFKFVEETKFTAKHFQDFVLKTHSQNPSITIDLFNFLLLRKKIILQNTIKTKQIIENSTNEQIKSDYQKLLNLKYQIAEQTTHLDTVKILNQKIEKLQKDISLQIYEEYPNNSSLNLIDFNKIKSELSDNEAVVEFTDFKDRATTYYCALVVRKKFKYPELIYLCTEKELQNALAKETPHTITAAHVKNIYAKDNKLYKYLFEKIEPILGGIEIVNISPSGLVHNIAFACLKDSNNVYLKDKYQIKYYVSFANLINEKDCFITQNNTNNIALFGDMKYDLNETQIQKIKNESVTRSMDMAFLFDKNKIGLQPLPATKSEVDSIETIFSKKNISCKKYTGTNAIEENFYELDNSQTEVLHIATHGYYFPDNQSATDFNIPMLNTNKIDNSYFKSGLFFSGATNSLNNDKSMANLADGILSAYEICNLNLSKVKLVVLSACLTGVGDIQQNEGVIGLSRAFKIAGADNLIISLWEVPSRQTAEFMIYFYKNIASGLSVDKAFAKAQKEMSEKYYTNPYYWGGFILLR